MAIWSKRVCRIAAAWVVAISCSPPRCAAEPPSVEYLFPAGAQRGTTVEVTAGGKFPIWPARAQSDLQGVELRAVEAKGKFEVVVAPDAPCGLHWLRFFDAQGASAPQPWLVGTLPEIRDEEPNDSPRDAQATPMPNVVNGQLSQRGDVDGFAVQLAAGETLVAALEAHERLGSPIDAVMQLCDSQGFVVQQNNDARGLDPAIVFTPQREGTYLVRVFAFPSQPNSTIGFASGDPFVYRLTLTVGGFIDHVMPLALGEHGNQELAVHGWNIPAEFSKVEAQAIPSHGPVPQPLRVFHSDLAKDAQLPIVNLPVQVEATDSGSALQEIAVPGMVCGHISMTEETDRFRFSANKGQKLQIAVASRRLGFPLDPVLSILDADGKLLHETDDSKNDRDPVFDFTAPVDGGYQIEVCDLHRRGGLRYAYRLSIEEQRPTFSLELAENALVVSGGKTVEVPVKITRDKGFEEEIEIRLATAPFGISAEEVKSPGKGEGSKEVKLIVAANGDAVSGPLVLEGAASGDGATVQSVRFQIQKTSTESDQVWITVLREN